MTIVDRLHRDDNIGSYPEINTHSSLNLSERDLEAFADEQELVGLRLK